jgi:predicted nucleotidyltransferase
MVRKFSVQEKMSYVATVKRLVDEEQNGKALYITISGSDLYGFPSKDSDIDLRGTYITGTEGLLGLSSPRDVIEAKPDIVMFEIKKELGLALKGNCNVLEHINSPWIYKTWEAVELKEMVNNSIGKRGLYKSYKGMAESNYNKFILQGRQTTKKYLYVFRGLMAGIHVLETGIIQPNIINLNKYFKIPEVKQLVQAKIQGNEVEPLKDAELLDSGVLDELIVKLLERIDRAYVKSKIPDHPDEDSIEAINKWLIERRIEKIGQ